MSGDNSLLSELIKIIQSHSQNCAQDEAGNSIPCAHSSPKSSGIDLQGRGAHGRHREQHNTQEARTSPGSNSERFHVRQQNEDDYTRYHNMDFHNWLNKSFVHNNVREQEQHNSNHTTYKDKCKHFKMLLTKYKSLSVENWYFSRCLHEHIVPKGLRITKFPNNIDFETDEVLFKEICAIFDECGLSVIKALMKHNESRMEKDKNTIDRLYKEISEDLLFSIDEYKRMYYRTIQDVDSSTSHNHNRKISKLRRDLKDYESNNAYNDNTSHYRQYQARGVKYYNYPHYIDHNREGTYEVNNDEHQNQHSVGDRNDNGVNYQEEYYTKMDISDTFFKLFAKGFTFVPHQTPCISNILLDIKLFTRRLNLSVILGNNISGNDSKRLKRRSIYNPPLQHDIQSFENVGCNVIRSNYPHHYNTGLTNLTEEENKLLVPLKSNKKVRIMKPDKGGGMVIMDQWDYMRRVLNILNNKSYCTVSRNEINIAYSNIDFTLEDNLLQGLYDKDLFEFFMVSKPVVPAIFGMPKIHKCVTDPPMRPIVSAQGSKTQPLAIYIDVKLKGYHLKYEHLLIDSWDLLRKINNINYSDEIIFVTIDVKDLFMVIPHDIGLTWFEEILMDMDTLKPEEFRIILENMELDALLKLGSTVDTESLLEAIQEGIAALLPKVENSFIYLLDREVNKFVCDDPTHELPQDGKVRDAVEKQKRIECNGLSQSELQEKQINSLVAPLPPDKRVLIIPLVDQEAEKVIAVILVRCSQLKEADGQTLSILEKHMSVACKRVQSLQKTSSWPKLSLTCTSSQNSLAKPDTMVNGTYNEMDSKILKLCGELYDLDAASLQLKVIHYLQQETQSPCCCLLLVSEDNHQLFCQVVGDKVLEEEISFPMTFARLEQFVEKKRFLTLQDISEEEHAQLNSILGFEVYSMLYVPVISRATGQVVALACAFNKKGGQKYTEEDEHKIQHCFCYTSTVLTSTLAFQKEQKLKCECQALLQVAKNLFTHLDNVSVLLQEIVTEARNLSNAEICSVFLLDRGNNELVAKVFDGGVVDDENNEFRIPADQGIAGHVATTGKILNIKDAYSHPLFYRGVDDSTGFRTRNILCFPIKDENNEVIGVAELVNKINGPWFSKFDEDLATAFSIYCGISIAHSLLYKKVHEAQYRSHLANEMMMYHMKVCSEEVKKVLMHDIQPVNMFHPNFARFSYTPRSLPEDSTAMAILSMFEDMGFTTNYKIDQQILARFCLMVKKGYRDPPYHNWTHAFSVSHFCYLLDKNLELSKYLEDIEILALFVSCMCHDLDHRGTNNSFQVASQSVLAALYSSEGSVMERHHFAQAIAILNTDGCNIFDQFSRKEYQRMLDLMRDIILATDLAHHLRIFKDLQKMAQVGYNPNNRHHHSLLLCLLMTSCDLSDQTKGWKTTRKIAELIYKEFFSQGDLEKAMGNRPSEMMDREKAYIPELQISFMEHIAMPVYKLLAEIFPKASELYEIVASNREQWIKASHKFTLRGLPSNNSLDFLDEEYDALMAADESAKMNGCVNVKGQMASAEE
ncbi:cGMP-dependent 3',5'-cyclic phosphodiesterase [Protopterus annectens]|uniref:cGMP-dependent 3',5'-cyclic phosphodiesterase n=1 Tax=Protopterus annectens TaxID=7888 RepID=UPI001CF9D451|nr:cGMP-dependent 3',5'-cyclic phosphodiesterase [Protopterus annectens]